MLNRKKTEVRTNLDFSTATYETEDRAYEKVKEKKVNYFMLMIPSVFDMTETALKNVTLTMISSSVT